MKRKIISSLLVLVLLLAVGFAAVSTSLVINGTIGFNTNEDDFEVIFTKSIIDGIDMSDSTISEDGKSITFVTSDLAILGDTSKLDFVVTNNSTQYDANVEMECVAEEEKSGTYYTINHTLPSVVKSKSIANGTVTATLNKTSVEAVEETFTCTINATAQERTNEEENKIVSLVYDENNDGIADIGDMIAIGTEQFYVTSNDGTNIKMLARYNLGTNYKQSKVENRVNFSDLNGWTTGTEIDIQQYDGNVKTYINEYTSYIKNEINNENIEVSLISLNELKNLGCMINDDYSYSDELTCLSSVYSAWLINGQYYWTKSSRLGNASRIWSVRSNGGLIDNLYDTSVLSVRPIITISVDLI